MYPVRTILHPTDFSEHSNAAFQVACALARDHGARVLVVHVIDTATVQFVGGMMPAMIEVPRAELTEQLDRIQAPDARVRVEHMLAEGPPVAEILRIAKEENCDLIVMGTHGRGFLGRVVMGSVAEGIVRQAECPVLTVRQPVTFRVEPTEIAQEFAGVS